MKTQSVSVKTSVSWSSSRSAHADTVTLLKVGVSAKRSTSGSSMKVQPRSVSRSTVAGSGWKPGRGANAYAGASAWAPPQARRLSTSRIASLSSLPCSTQNRKAGFTGRRG